MLTTRFVNGAPNWLDVGTSDIDGAISFYRDLFGWQFRSAGPDSGGYGFFQLAGRTVAGGMQTTSEQGRRPGPSTSGAPTPRPPPRPPSRRAAACCSGPWTCWARAAWPSSPTPPVCPSASGSRGGPRGSTWPGSRAHCAGSSCSHRTSPAPPRSTARCWAGSRGRVLPRRYVHLHQPGRRQPADGVRRTGAAGRRSRGSGVGGISAAVLRGHRHRRRRTRDSGARRHRPDAPDGCAGVGRIARLADPYGARFAVITSAPQEPGQG